MIVLRVLLLFLCLGERDVIRVMSRPPARHDRRQRVWGGRAQRTMAPSVAAADMAEQRELRQISKPQLRDLKKRVAQLRKKGFDVWTDDELEREGWTLTPPPPSAAELATPSRAQAADWDCGLACVQMVLLALGVGATECTLTELRKRLTSNSVWTADLVFLLASYGIECEYLTSELGAGADSADRAGSAFYSASLDADAARVNALFARAEEEGVVIRR
eukprot:scaffold95058_cov30-Tisochrysis_lutea.AAC.5